jgi:hypothetical protein
MCQDFLIRMGLTHNDRMRLVFFRRRPLQSHTKPNLEMK